MSYRFDFSFLAERWPAFLEGAWLTIQLTVVSIALGFVLGTLCAVLRVYGGGVVRRLIGVYVEMIRNTPLLVQIFIVYFGLASLGMKLGAELSAIIALVINVGAYTTEIMRAGIESTGAEQPVRALDAGIERDLANLGGGIDGGRQRHSVGYLSQLRGLSRGGGGLSGAVISLSLRFLADRQVAVRPTPQARHRDMRAR
jgi:His/Glu/Gln/Arg/opine family amino acid ABC transporter permease subunit